MWGRDVQLKVLSIHNRFSTIVFDLKYTIGVHDGITIGKHKDNDIVLPTVRRQVDSVYVLNVKM